MVIGSGCLCKAAADYGGYYQQREPGFWDTFADHPVFLAGSGAVAGGLLGGGAHALAERSVRRHGERALDREYANFGKSYEAARNAGANIANRVEADAAKGKWRANITSIADKNKRWLANLGKFKVPAIGAGALLGGLLAYNHFFG